MSVEGMEGVSSSAKMLAEKNKTDVNNNTDLGINVIYDSGG